MFWNVIDSTRKSVLRHILESPPIENFYLAGGTALALLLGHRESIDFDWFTPDPFASEQIETNLSRIGDLMVTEAKKNTFHGLLDGVQVTWLRYPRPLLEPLIVTSEMDHLRIASLEDIGTMKLIAASQRGARKDFIDLYMIEQSGVSLTSLIKRLPEKFPNTSINYILFIFKNNFWIRFLVGQFSFLWETNARLKFVHLSGRKLDLRDATRRNKIRSTRRHSFDFRYLVG